MLPFPPEYGVWGGGHLWNLESLLLPGRVPGQSSGSRSAGVALGAGLGA